MNPISSYEVLLILDPEISDEDRQSFQTKLENEITSQGGHVTNLELWGKRTLAYEIKDRTEGYYLLVHFDLPRKSINALRTSCSQDPRVLRHKIFRLDLSQVPSTGGSE